jgi:hypothetical protein
MAFPAPLSFAFAVVDKPWTRGAKPLPPLFWCCVRAACSRFTLKIISRKNNPVFVISRYRSAAERGIVR